LTNINDTIAGPHLILSMTIVY